jgi:hypothetical protein
VLVERHQLGHDDVGGGEDRHLHGENRPDLRPVDQVGLDGMAAGTPQDVDE